MSENPFSLDFGGTPNLFIPRYDEMNRIINTFSATSPTTHIFMIMGARGNGKTVLMSAVTEELTKSDKWIHIDISPESDMLNVLASGLYQKSKKRFSKLKIDLNIDLKIASIGTSSEIDDKYSSVYTDLDNMLEQLRDKGLKLLITIDEVFNSKNVREFTSFFQHCIREKYPVFLLMTGLYKNIRALQNNRSQTFLKRAPKVMLGPLNSERISQKYMEVFNLSNKDATQMANHTKGYSYAFQILGFIVFESGKAKVTNEILTEYRLTLGECSYDKIWEELSANEQRVAWFASKAPSNATVKSIREKLDMSSNEFSTYSDTLEKCGVFSSNGSYGRVEFALPYIKEYIAKKVLD